MRLPGLYTYIRAINSYIYVCYTRRIERVRPPRSVRVSRRHIILEASYTREGTRPRPAY